MLINQEHDDPQGRQHQRVKQQTQNARLLQPLPFSYSALQLNTAVLIASATLKNERLGTHTPLLPNRLPSNPLKILLHEGTTHGKCNLKSFVILGVLFLLCNPAKSCNKYQRIPVVATFLTAVECL